MGHFFEAMMLVCFGFSWPLNVVKAYKARTTKGTSLAFIVLIITGYVAGITAKFLNGQLNYVLAVYFLNLAIVLTNVFVYIRNKNLDKKREVKACVSKILEIKKNKTNLDYLQEDNMNYQELNKIAQKNAVVLFGGTLDKSIPVTELAESFDFNFKLYNRSEECISIRDAKDFYQKNIKSLEAEGLLIHLGEEDVTFFQSNPSEFDKVYLELVYEIQTTNKKCRVALTSVYNPENNKVINDLNRHIKAIAEAEKCSFVNLDNVKLWNPKGTKAASAFARNMGLNIRKPLNDVAEILYSYAYIEAAPIENKNELVG